ALIDAALKAYRAGDPEPRFQCNDCGKKFTRRENLTAHISSHAEEKPTFACGFPGCDKTFGRADVRSRHRRTEHGTNPVQHICDGCGQRFKRRDALRQHLRTPKAQIICLQRPWVRTASTATASAAIESIRFAECIRTSLKDMDVFFYCMPTTLN